MIGSPQHNAKPPSKEVIQSIAQLASPALQQTVGRAWALSDANELHLLEELSSILTQQRPFSERLQDVGERARAATGFTSIGLVAQGTKTASGQNPAALAVDEAAYSEEYVDRAFQFYATDDALDETRRFFEGREGPLLFADPAQLSTMEEQSKRWMIEAGIRFLVQISLAYGDEYLGTLRITSTYSERETWERLRVFTALASHIAAILKNVRLFEEVQDANASLTLSHHATVRTLAYAAEARDPFTGQHLRNIEAYTTALAAELELSPEDVEAVRFGAVLHDVGKLRVPDSILLEPGSLDKREWDLNRQHPLAKRSWRTPTSPRSRCRSLAGITSGGMAAATPTASPPTRSRSPCRSSQWPTSSTRSPLPGHTSTLGRPTRRWPRSSRMPGANSHHKSSKRSTRSSSKAPSARSSPARSQAPSSTPASEKPPRPSKAHLLPPAHTVR